MRQMYKGSESKPVQEYMCSVLLKEGWTYHRAETKESDSKEETEEVKDKATARKELAESLGVAVVDEEGKPLHYKLIDSAIKEAQENEHNEG